MLEDILVKYFGAEKPFLDERENTGTDNDPMYNYLTESGSEAYDKLISLLYDLENMGLNLDANNIIEDLDSIVSNEY